MVRTLAVGAIAAALVVTAATPAWADLYTCHDKSGRVWVTNYKVKGARCVVGIKSSKPKPVDKAKRGGDAAAAGARKVYRPNGRRAATSADEPADREGRQALYEPYVEEAAELHGLPEAFIRAVIRVESNFKYRAVSHAGAQGLMQLMPQTAREMGVEDPFDPRANVLGGARLIRVLANRYDGDMVKVLSAYHAGAGAVARKGGIPFEKTESYVRAVLDHYYQYKVLGE